MNVANALMKILDGHDDYRKGEYCLVSKIHNGFELKYGREYSVVQISFAKLKALSEFFGTDEIDVNDYASSGCDTCDYGSDYGYTIQIYNPTKNVSELESLDGQDLVGIVGDDEDVD